MSRAMNISLSHDQVTAVCRKHGAAISVIETLPGGCTRVVLRRSDKVAAVQRAFGKQVVTTHLDRTPRMERRRSSYPASLPTART